MSKKAIPWLLLSPALIFYLMFWIVPVITGVVESFTDAQGKFTFANFVMIFQSDSISGNFGVAILNTLIFVLISIVLQYVLALILALILNMKSKFSKALLFIVMIPMAITPTAVAIIWKTGLETNGWINTMLVSMGLIKEGVNWLNAEGFNAILLIVTIDTWTVLPSVVIIIYAGLQNLNAEFKEAGEVFGASKWQIVKDIVIPILKPSIITSLLLRMIAAAQMFVLVAMVFGYGTLPFMVERIAWLIEKGVGLENAEKMAYAMCVIVTVIVFGTSMIYYKLSKKNSVLEAQD